MSFVNEKNLLYSVNIVNSFHILGLKHLCLFTAQKNQVSPENGALESENNQSLVKI